MRFASLGSGSQGNALIVEAGGTRLLLDCGFSIREVTLRLARLGIDPGGLTAILVTHEHADHVGGVFAFARRHRLAVYLTHGTYKMAARGRNALTDCHLIDGHAVFAIDDIELRPFPVPHDAREPVQFVVGDGARRLGVLTDVGETTGFIESSLRGCDALFLEANHCEDMLANSRYPASLKARIAGRYGHLSNRVAALLLARLAHSGLQRVVAAHLSRENNRPDLAREAFANALGGDVRDIHVASQDDGLDWVVVA